MKFSSLSKIFVLLAVLLSIGDLQAQFEYKWLTVGSMQSPYSSGGALREQEPFDNGPIQYPAIDHRAGNNRAYGVWIGTTNFTDEKNRTFPYKVAHIGPRSGGAVQFFNTSAKVISRINPEVTVDGALSFLRYVFVDEFDPAMKADRMVHITANTRVGVEFDLKAYAFSQEYHDNYHIIEYTFKNTGNIDTDAEIELPNKTLEGVYFFFINRYATHEAASWVTGNGAPWGKFTMNDAVGDGIQDYGVNFRAQWSWAGYYPDQTDFNSLGGPMWREAPGWSAPNPDTTGRLASAHYVGRVYIHADRSASDPSDDRSQPSTMGVKGSDDKDLVDDEFNNGLMERQYKNFMQLGRQNPTHAYIIEPSGQFDKQTKSPHTAFGVSDEGGWAFVEGFGPYRMQPGEDVKLVVAEGAAGLSHNAKLTIGRDYKASGANDEALLEYPRGSGQRKTKNQWVISSRDSLFQMFDRAIANYNSGFNIPQPPLPPEKFTVTSGPGKITLAWQPYQGATQSGWEIYRKSKQWQDQQGYELIASLPADARSYDDAEQLPNGPDRGLDYFYYLQAVGPINTNPTGNTPTGVALRSGRYYAQTYLPANLKRAPGRTLDDIRIVPNPYYISADESFRYGERDDRIGFLDIPGRCTIKIYSQLGELIDTIEHGDGTGDAFWLQTTTSRQLVVSGIYIAVITNNETGAQTTKKFVIIR